jgi:glycerol-3-phosphate O-acyltransferase
VMSEINRATAVTPGAVVATALLNHRRRGISHGDLLAASGRIAKVLRGLGARISDALLDSGGELRDQAIYDAVHLFIGGDIVVANVPGEGAGAAERRRAKIYTGTDVVYVVPDDKRLSLDLSKNIIVHFFVPRALVATGLSAQVSRPSAVPRATLEERVRQLSRLFKFEFMFRAEATFEQNFAETVAEMSAAGELAQNESGDIVPGPGHDGLHGEGWIEFYSSIVLTFLESYRVAARGLTALLKGPMQQKDLVKRALAAGDRMFLAGEIERREAVSRPTIENAYLAFTDQGYISLSQGKLSLTESFATQAAVRAIESKVMSYFAGGEAF